MTHNAGPNLEQDVIINMYMYIQLLFGPRSDDVTKEWRKLHNEELNGLYFSPNLLRVVKSRWAGHVACMGGRVEVYIGFWWGNLRERDHLGDPGVDGRTLSTRSPFVTLLSRRA